MSCCGKFSKEENSLIVRIISCCLSFCYKKFLKIKKREKEKKKVKFLRFGVAKGECWSCALVNYCSKVL